MAFRIIVGDITKFEGDVIINSVGVTSTIYGGVCGSIVKALNSKEYEETLSKVNNYYSVGEFFITDIVQGFPSKHILNLITPHYENDKDLSLFKYCLKTILNECNSKGFYKVGIPSIGTGANKYPKEEVRKIMKDMCTAYSELYEKMDIYLVLPEKEIGFLNDERLKNHLLRNGEYHDEETLKKFKSGAKKIEGKAKKENTSTYSRKFFDYQEYKIGVPNVNVDFKKVSTLGDYVDLFVEKNTSEEAIYKNRIKKYLSYNKKNKEADVYYKKTTTNDPDKISLFKTIFALKLPIEAANELLNHFGYCFANNPSNKLDKIVEDLISKKQYGLIEIEQRFKKDKVEFF